MKKIQILLFWRSFWERIKEQWEWLCHKYIASLAVSAIALTGVAPAIDYRMKTMKDGMRLGESRVKSLGLKFSSMTPGEGNCFMEAVYDQIKSIPALKNFCTSPDNLRW